MENWIQTRSGWGLVSDIRSSQKHFFSLSDLIFAVYKNVFIDTVGSSGDLTLDFTLYFYATTFQWYFLLSVL